MGELERIQASVVCEILTLKLKLFDKLQWPNVRWRTTVSCGVLLYPFCRNRVGQFPDVYSLSPVEEALIVTKAQTTVAWSGDLELSTEY